MGRFERSIAGVVVAMALGSGWAAGAAAQQEPEAAGQEAEDLGPVVRTGIPEEVLSSVVGCWERDDQERWYIRRGEHGSASVFRVILGEAAHFYGRRARLRSALLYRPSDRRLGFAGAGRIHELLLIFVVADGTLHGHYFSHRNPHAAYYWTGSTFTMTRCAR